MHWPYCGDIQIINETCPVLNGSVYGTDPADKNGFLDKPTFHVIFELYIIGVLCLIGLLGNIMSLVVLRRDSMRKETLLMLQALAVADGCYVIVAILRYPVQYFIPRDVYVSMDIVVYPLIKSFQTIAIWMMVGVTIDRFVYVCWPLRARAFFTPTRRKLLACCIFIGGFLYNLPRCFESCIWRMHDTCSNFTHTEMIYRAEFNSDAYLFTYIYGMYLVFLYIAPLVGLAYMNSCLVKAIQQSRRFQRQSSSASERVQSDNNATLVLIIIVLIFIVCETPELLLRVFILIDRVFGRELIFHEGVLRLIVVSECLMVLNSSVNFFIYVVFGKRFRFIMKETLKHLTATNATFITHETAPLHPMHNMNHYLPNKL